MFSHPEGITCVAFSPDGKTVLTGGADQTARLWDAATGRPIGDALIHRGRVVSVAFSPDGKSVLTGDDEKSVRLWDVSELPDDLERVSTLVEVLTGLELDEQGQVRTLGAAAWRERREQMGRGGGSLETR